MDKQREYLQRQYDTAKAARLEIETDLDALEALTAGSELTHRERMLRTRLNTELTNALLTESNFLIALTRLPVSRAA